MSSPKTLKIEFKDLPNQNRTNTPVLLYCRKLISSGIDPKTRLEVTRNGRVDLIVKEIGKGAELTVDETHGCKFAKYSYPT